MSDMQGIRVGLIDDQALVRGAIRIVIDAQPDMTVVGEAADGVAGLELIEKLKPDVVLLDLRMPTMSGVELVRSLAEKDALSQRVIVLTTFELDADAAEAIRLGASGFLLKDTSPEFLLASIRSVMTGKKILAPDNWGALLPSAADGAGSDPALLQSLTARERSVLDVLLQGASNKEVAETLHLSQSTVKTHVSSIYSKLGVRDRLQLVVLARDAGLMPPS